MATAAIHPGALRRASAGSAYDVASGDLVERLFFMTLLLVAPIQSVLLTRIQGTTPAFMLTLASTVILARPDRRYARLLLFIALFVVSYAFYLGLSLSGYTIDLPELSRAIPIRNIFIWEHLRQTHVTQGLYLLATSVFCFLTYNYYQEYFVKYMYYGILLLLAYGAYEFLYYALYQSSGDFLSNRTFDSIRMANTPEEFNTGSLVQPSNLLGSNYMRLKSLTGEPSMYALTVTPFAVYAFAQRWWLIFGVLFFSLFLSTATTAVIGIVVGLSYVQLQKRQVFILYLIGAALTSVLLYTTSDAIRDAVDTLLFKKLETVSGTVRLQAFWNHFVIIFDGNVVRFLFGLGFGTVRSTDMLSSLLANVGMIGWLLYSAIWLAPCLLLRKGGDRDALVAALLATYAMQMLTVPEYGYLPPWFFVAMAYARVAQQRALEARSATPAPHAA